MAAASCLLDLLCRLLLWRDSRCLPAVRGLQVFGGARLQIRVIGWYLQERQGADSLGRRAALARRLREYSD